MAVSLIGVLPAVDAAAETYSGSCGDNVTWSLDTSTGVLTISGTGDMYDYIQLGGGGASTGYSPSWSSFNSDIQQVEIEDGVTSIGEQVFVDCENLKSIKIPSSVTSIGDYAFWCCKSLMSITIPDSVTSIGDEAFESCIDLTNITIGNGVTSIGQNAFWNCTSLTSITIPNSVTSIGYEAFEDCGITSVTIPKSVTYIGEQAFGYYYDDDKSDYVKTKNYKIYCYVGTAGEEYAINNGFDYELLDGSNTPNNPNSNQSNKPNNNSTKPNQTTTPTASPTNNKKTTPSTTKVSVSKPAKVKSVKLTAKKKKLNVSWKKVSGATGYEVMYAKNNKFTKGKKTVKVKKNKVILKRLKSKKKYFVKVRAYKTVNGNTNYGKWSKVVKKKVK